METKTPNYSIGLLLKENNLIQFGKIEMSLGTFILLLRRSKKQHIKFSKSNFKIGRNIVWLKCLNWSITSTWVNAENTANMDEQVTVEKLLQTLNEMVKDKSPRPNGQPDELFLHFLDLMGLDLVNMVETFKMSGKIPGAINSTFLTLIPNKVNDQLSKDYRPIPLYCSVFKMMSKIIVNRIKNTISPHILLDHLGFLSNRRIRDIIAISQEVIHSVKSNKQSSCLMKFDLIRDYYCVNCELLTMILYKIGFNHRHVH